MMKKQILNSILKKSNFLVTDYKDNLICSIVIPLIFALLFFTMIMVFCISQAFLFFSVLFGILIFVILLMIIVAIIEWDKFNKFKNIYNKYPEILTFLYQNKHKFKEIDSTKITNYNFSNNYHYIRFLIQNNDFNKLKEIMPIFNEEKPKYILLNDKIYNIDSQSNFQKIQTIIDDIDNLKAQFPNIQYPKYPHSEINENKLHDYYNRLLIMSYQKI